MAIPVLMPALSPTMTEGKLARWLKAEGDEVAPGDVIAEIETDKATMEVEAVDEGRMGRLLIAEGTDEVAVNTPIAVILEEGEDASAADNIGTGAAAPPPAAPKTDEAPPAPQSNGADPASAAAPAPEAPKANGERVFASPLARRMAKQAGLDLGTVQGSGPHGRIVKADIEAAVAGGPAAKPQPAATRAPAAPAVGEPDFELVPHSSMRKVIAQRLTESKQTVPHFYMTVDCELDALLALRKQLNAKAEAQGTKLSVNDFVIKAAALALIQVPAANASWTPEGTKLYRSADISVAVAIDGGLVTPVIRGAHAKGLAAISGDMKALAAKARDGKLVPEEYQGGTFSISNLGMFGIKQFEAVINPPQGAILAVGAGEQRPVVKDGALAVATVMSCTLSVDHRVVDGAVGAAFLAAFKAIVEDPLTIML